MSISTLTNWWGRTYPRFLYPARATPKPILPSLDERVRAEGDCLWAQLDADRLSFARIDDGIRISGEAA